MRRNWFALLAMTTLGCNALLDIEDHGLSAPEKGDSATDADASRDIARFDISGLDERTSPFDTNSEASLRDGDTGADAIATGPDAPNIPDVSVDGDVILSAPDASTDSGGKDQVGDIAVDVAVPDVSMDGSQDAKRPRDGDDSADHRDGTTPQDDVGAGDIIVDAPIEASTCNNCPVPTAHGTATCEAGVCGVACETNYTPCGSECVDVVSDAIHCGRCSHSCGNGLCSQGICQPTTIHSGIDAPRDLALDSGGVYFPLTDRLLHCPLEGCVQAPRQLASNLGVLSKIAVANGTIAYIATYDVNACLTSGCDVNSPVLWTGAGAGNRPGLLFGSGADIYAGFFGEGGNVNYRRCVAPSPACSEAIQIVGGVLRPPVVVDNGKIFMTNARVDVEDAGITLVACDVGQPCTANMQTIATWWEPARELLAATGGTLYFPDRDDNGLNITSCPEAGGCMPRQFFARILNDIVELIADSSGVHWIQGPAQSASIVTCPLQGCSGGPQIVARNQPLASFLRSDGQFLYWVNRGTPIDGGTDPEPGTASIVRVAR